MNVRELIQALSELDPERVVVLSSDSEGNSFSELSDRISVNVGYVAEDREVWLEKLTPELVEGGCTEEDTVVGRNAVPAVVLMPKY